MERPSEMKLLMDKLNLDSSVPVKEKVVVPRPSEPKPPLILSKTRRIDLSFKRKDDGKTLDILKVLARKEEEIGPEATVLQGVIVRNGQSGKGGKR